MGSDLSGKFHFPQVMDNDTKPIQLAPIKLTIQVNKLTYVE
ncbi:MULTISPECIES: hypothetical protein [unclassified Mucilaginibacter]|nr:MULTISPECIES: hypothetical protein [unclassified Mucilaginibacter]MEB0262727.1 hypothetical protein [Mucilaginibacter sp. 10I4]MEB0279498.1 hypothetical protein [Mucilaginibacter sp. 10B2]MEB0302796.1 hypothetical protein [Mucilaginibacter sp. 5C4]WPX22634.1 hypothetical protein RHM67_15235 [Mucilaginibacter sp. 5C4]